MKTIKNLKAEEIRKSILQLAIQGKLVKQDPNDEPASELIKRIYEEKKRLIAEGKIKKDKNESYIFKGDDNCYYEKIGNAEPVKLEDLPFDIPDNWMWIKMENANSIVVGATPSTSNPFYWSNGTIPWLPSGCCQDCEVYDTYSKIKYISEAGYNSCSTTMMDEETVLIALTGATAGKVGILKFKACANQSVVGIKPYYGIDTKFLFFQLMTRRNEILSDCIGSAQPHISKEYVTKIYFTLPPLEEQQRIVDKINSFEPLLQEYEKYEKELTELESAFAEKLKKSILQYAIEGKLVRQDPNDEPASVLLERIKAEKEKFIKEGKIKRDKNESYIYQGDDKNYYEKVNQTIRIIDVPFVIPGTWSWIRTKTLFDVVSASRVHQSDWKSKGIPFYRAREIAKLSEYGFVNNELFISNELFLKLSKNGIPEENDLMITAVGTLGKTYIVKKNDRFYYKDASVISLKNKFNQNINYMDLLFKTPYMLDLIKEKATGTTVGTITIEKAANYLIPFPPSFEQSRIVNIFKQIAVLIND